MRPGRAGKILLARPLFAHLGGEDRLFWKVGVDHSRLRDRGSVMQRLLWAAMVGASVLAAGAPARGQVYGGPVTPYGTGTYYASPGYYGTGYGVPAFGVPRMYSAFSSPYGLGYGYGYAPYNYLPGAFGIGLWRPGA